MTVENSEGPAFGNRFRAGPLSLERVTGIEPALSAWELDGHASLTSTPQVRRHLRLSVGIRQVPPLALPSGM
jgi:hypothetical protein